MAKKKRGRTFSLESGSNPGGFSLVSLSHIVLEITYVLIRMYRASRCAVYPYDEGVIFLRFFLTFMAIDL